MSAKGIGAPSVHQDNYRTPPSMVTRLVEACPDVRVLVKRANRDLLDPTAGEGQLLRTLRDLGPARLHAIEIRPECRDALGALDLASLAFGDCLRAPHDADEGADLVITNPPFSEIEAIARRYRREDRVLALLSRAPWPYGSQSSCALLDEIGHPDTYGFRERPSYVRIEYRDEESGKLLDAGGTDNVGAAWRVWSGPPRSAGKSFLLRLPTLAEKAYRPPTRVLYVALPDWEARKKKARFVREEWRA